ncbi:MAG: hypothetical protein E7225_00790 [Clostridiales bacterium]|nr:hypothetical protein [Clostridiales bacterium]
MKKRILSVVLVICMILSFAACGNKSNNVVYDYDYDLSEYITIGEYIGIEYEPSKLEVKQGDVVSIDYAGFQDGVAFDGGTGSYDLTIGSGAFIDGFEDGLIGHTVGDFVKLNLTFPEDYKNAPDMAGQEVVFEVKINAINYYTEARELDEQVIWDKYYTSCEVIKYPDKEYKSIVKQQEDYYKQYATNYGMTFNQFLEDMGTTREEFDADVQSYAESMIAQDMALYALVRDAGIEASEEELENAKNTMLETYGVEDEEEFKKVYGLDFNDKSVQNSLEMTALLNQALDLLVENAVPVAE